MVTALAIAQQAASRLQLPSPATLVGNTDNNVILIKAMMEEAAQEIRNAFNWPELQKEYLFTLSADTPSYPFPGDYDRTQFETLWNRTQHWPLIGPLDAVTWQVYKSGLITVLPRQRFRIRGWADSQFFIDPTPEADIAGQECVYEYITRTIFKPKTWVTATSFAASSYCSYNGNIYQTTAGGITGATPPTWTSGTQSDGTVSWTFYAFGYETILADTDQSILDYQMILDGTVWRWKRERGLDFELIMKIAMDQIDMAKTRLMGAGVINYSSNDRLPMYIGIWSYPTGNF